MTTKKPCADCKESLKILVDQICEVKEDTDNLQEFVADLDDYTDVLCEDIDLLEDRTDDIEEMEKINSDRLINFGSRLYDLEDSVNTLTVNNRIMYIVTFIAVTVSIIAICN